MSQKVTHNENNYYKRQSQGFSLIEVLVTLTVVSIGLLGLAGLQTSTQQHSRNAYYHTQTTIISQDMSERMRANSVALLAKNYHLVTPLRSAGCNTNAGCSPQQMANNDSYEWAEIIKNQLPQGRGVVCIDSSPDDGTSSSPACDNTGSQYAIKLWWHNTIEEKTMRSVSVLGFE